MGGMSHSESIPATPAERLPWWKAPYFQLTLSIVFSAAAQLLNKEGAVESISKGAIFGFQGLTSLWVWAGQTCMVLSLVSWIYALRTIPLHIAFNLTGTIQVIIPLASWFILGEVINGQRWLGIALILAGVFITARQAGELEEKL
jgi:drug/metabolite transporter (DMT)-like permease